VNILFYFIFICLAECLDIECRVEQCFIFDAQGNKRKLVFHCNYLNIVQSGLLADSHNIWNV
jgi:hypothetical protein